MKTSSATRARSDLSNLIAAVVADREPIRITSQRGNAVLIGEDHWRAIQASLHLISIPGMRESILKGMAESVDKCSRKIDL